MGSGYTGIADAPEADELQERWAMSDRPRFFDDLAGVAGGAFSALAGLREEAQSMVRAQLDEMIRRLELVRKEELEAMAEVAANARGGQEAAEARIADLEARLAVLEARVVSLESTPKSDP
jgi:BMFP domain-containing protein YqiC